MTVEPTKNPFVVGLDLGQQNDYTAVALLERVDHYLGQSHWDYSHRVRSGLAVRFLERFPLGISYAKIAERIRDLINSPLLQERSRLVIDATGVGAPVVDMLRGMQLRATIVPGVITGGDTVSNENGRHRVPKKDLVASVSVLLQQEILQLPSKLPLAETLVDEMLNFRIRINLEGAMTFEAWRTRDHDDLVLAVALACWQAQRLWPHLIVPGDHAYFV